MVPRSITNRNSPKMNLKHTRPLHICSILDLEVKGVWEIESCKPLVDY